MDRTVEFSLSLSLSLMGLRFLQENHDFGERWNWV
jgi:hypothetical protein